MSFNKQQIKSTLDKAAVKNMLRGAIFAAIYLVTTLIIPFLTFTWIQSIEIEGVKVDIQKGFASVYFYLIAFGLLISGTAFFAYSSPKQSIRRGVFSLIQIILNCLYLWSYKFSGALEVQLELIDLGVVTISLRQMILTYMGIYFLTVILKTYDLVDFVVNREKIRYDRGKK